MDQEKENALNGMKIPLSPFMAALEIITLLLIVSCATVIFAKYEGLPEFAASHFDMLGRPDAWTDKVWLLVVLFAAVVVYAAVSVVECFPQIFNIPVKTDENNGKSVLRVIGVGVAFAKLMITLMLLSGAVFTCFENAVPPFLYIGYIAVFLGGSVLFVVKIMNAGKAV
ncbi:MAG: DUF1648 domain-containing protein [Clostridiales bacterium]|jgi:uncharacterized membrane protein|nr:DUF1648 domain-containing protein [Clostridiales bacterium]